MKSTTWLALAVAGTCAWSAGAFAGGAHHSAQMHPGMSVEVQTPSSVDESAPWLTGQAHLGGWTSTEPALMASAPEHEFYSDASFATGSSSGASGAGSVGSDSLAAAETTEETREYWLIGAASSETGIGSSASESASGSVGFDSSMTEADHAFDSASSGEDTVIHTSSAEALIDASGEDTPFVSEVYLVPGPLSSFDESDAFVLAIAPTREDIALLESLKEDFYIVTPSYDIG